MDKTCYTEESLCIKCFDVCLIEYFAFLPIIRYFL